jgi:hypothetical protein
MRAPAIGIGIGVGLASRGGGAITTPITLLGSAVQQWIRPDLGITESGGRVSQWNDQTTNNWDYTQADVARRPLLSTNGGPNNMPYASNDDATRKMVSSLPLRAPATGPSLIWIVGRAVTWVNTRAVVGNETQTRRLVNQGGVTPAVTMNDGAGAVNSNVNGIVGEWRRYAVMFSNSTADFLKIGGTNQTGTSAGTTAVNTARYLGSAGVSNTSAVFDFADVVYAYPATAAEALTMLASLDGDYGIPRYGNDPFTA